DSLFLTQVALQLQRRFRVRLTFRQLMESHPSLSALARHLDAQPSQPGATPPPAPVPPAPVPPAPVPPAPAVTAPAVTAPAPAAPGAGAGGVPENALQRVIDEQLRLMQQQLALLGGQLPPTPPAPAETPAEPAVAAVPREVAASDPERAFGAIARIHTAAQELSPMQRARLDAFVRRHVARTRGSKHRTAESRARLADPRVVTGFRPAIKELVYPISVDRSAGSRVWDVDGNVYVDVLNGFGASLLGWQPPFVTEAVVAQLARGCEIGPMHPLAGEVAGLVCDLTGFDRAAFCNTGSEAVMGAIRIARTVTGRSLIAMFSGSYHGGFDEVVVRAARGGRAVPAAPGILPETAQNVIVLEYGTAESLEILRSRADELAAVLVEPVQSRRPELQPRDFLHELRSITERAGTAYIVDEMVTGFRIAPGGAQEHFGVRGDIATYGKAVGGGLPIGIIAGRREWMDALDGGHWEYGDASMPTVGVTYFAGTFVRHPLALAAARAVLEHLRREGPALQRRLTETTAEFAADLNRDLQERGAPLEIRHFGSLWRPVATAEHPHGELLFPMLRDRGVHILEGFPCFFTTAHSAADIELVATAFRESVAEMQEAGFLRR
ncbi:MAG TPA: aminotransferase class III-fold pyridoxal phosphate-dependent enzyme, partial [Candidatus Dormibacteraeota bacterium]